MSDGAALEALLGLGQIAKLERWRYGKWPDGEELYNLSNDPDEKHNLAGNGNQAERLEGFRKLLAAKQEEARAFRAP